MIRAEVFTRLNLLPQKEKFECWNALLQLSETFGRPHVHSGIGIRKLGRWSYECRGNRDLRMLFLNLESGLEVCFLGNHDEVRAELKKGLYK